MITKNFTSTATSVIANFGTAAHKAIGLYREGGERLADTFDQRWKAAMKESAPKLTPETRKNANHAHQVFNGYFTKGVALSADGAEVVIDTVVGAAVAAIGRAASFQHTYAQKA